MSSLGLRVYIGRTRLGLDPLSLQDPDNGLQVVSIDPGQRSLELRQDSSPVSDGNVLTGYKASMQVAKIVVQVSGTVSEISTLMKTIEKAVSQFSYVCSVYTDVFPVVDEFGAPVLDGLGAPVYTDGPEIERWLCQPGNSSRGGNSSGYDMAVMGAGFQNIMIEIPRSPDSYTSS